MFVHFCLSVCVSQCVYVCLCFCFCVCVYLSTYECVYHALFCFTLVRLFYLPVCFLRQINREEKVEGIWEEAEGEEPRLEYIV